MIKNYLKTAWRTMAKNKVYSTINIVGLTIGLCACMLVGTVVLDDLSYDKFWSRKDDLYRILSVSSTAGLEGKEAQAFANLNTELKKNFPEVEEAAAIETRNIQLSKEKTAENVFDVHMIRTDTNVWKMLDIRILEGNPQNFVAGQGNLVISKSLKEKYFPKEDPVGKIIYSVSSYNDEPRPYLITGIMADLPSNTYLRSEAMEIAKPYDMPLSTEGGGYFVEQMLLMKSNTDMAAFSKKANQWYRNFLTDVKEGGKAYIPTFEFQRIDDIYLHSDFTSQPVKGSTTNIYIFSIVTTLLLFIACINFVNLSTARALKRLKETGVRKVLGAQRRQLILQFITECLLFFAISTVMASIWYLLSIGPLERFIGHSLTVTYFSKWATFLSLFLTILVIGIITGSYPAWVTSRFDTAGALRNQVGNTPTGGLWMRKTLIVFQFGIAILVLIGMVVVRSQVHFMVNKDLGFSSKGLLAISQFASGTSAQSLKQELQQIPGIEKVSLSGWTPTIGEASMGRYVAHPDNPDSKVLVNYIFGDADLPDVLGLHANKGRLFDQREARDTLPQNIASSDKQQMAQNALTTKALMTASTASLFHIDHTDQPWNEFGITPIGIVKDFHNISLREPIKPTIIFVDNNPSYTSVLILVKAGTEAKVLPAINKLWQQFHPNMPLKLEWVDDMLQKQYDAEAKQQQLFGFFSALTLLLASLGIFGLVVYTAEQRTKEIGIRKVLGATVSSIVRLLSKDFVKLVLLAIVIASPVAWWAMNKWLEDFAYKIEIQWWMFALAGLVAVVVAVFTVATQAIKAAMANPVESLRDE
ncbi:FtsX-like permease family protein [Olivibacter sitiensis]|uniref:FtsX-like permease family protein n=1 Tax=Olivibacter sitiensis TaxID=376470 RepID=UPI0003FB71A5|nr:FtsX-like permease family protein [Olivibacter sitiensis]